MDSVNMISMGGMHLLSFEVLVDQSLEELFHITYWKWNKHVIFKKFNAWEISDLTVQFFKEFSLKAR